MFKKIIQLDIFLDVLYKSNYRRFTTLLLPLSDVSDDNNSAKKSVTLLWIEFFKFKYLHYLFYDDNLKEYEEELERDHADFFFSTNSVFHLWLKVSNWTTDNMVYHIVHRCPHLDSSRNCNHFVVDSEAIKEDFLQEYEM